MANNPVLWACRNNCIDYTKLSSLKKIAFAIGVLAIYYPILFIGVVGVFGFYEKTFDPDPYEGVLDGARVVLYFFVGNTVLFAILLLPVLRLFRATRTFICALGLLSYPILIGIFVAIFAVRLIAG